MGEDIVKTVRQKMELEGFFGIDFVPYESPDDMARANGAEELNELGLSAATCQLCKLAKTRKNVVFGDGDSHADLMFIGEGPGEQEDIQGLPFVGRAGQLLTKIINAIDLERKDVYITNVVKCRPPGNRNPEPEEMLACAPYLAAQVKLIKPKIVCALGRVAAQAILQTDKPIGMLRGTFHEWQGVLTMPTFHPAYLLRNPSGKREVWEDMKKVRDRLNELRR